VKATKSNEVVLRDITFRVKPMVRHAVTYVEDTVYADGSEGGAGGTMCEVNSEEAANQIQMALEMLHAPRKYVVVQRSFEPGNCIVYYAYTAKQAKQFQDVLQKHYQTDFRIYEQPILDPHEAENYRLQSNGPAEHLMVRDGKVELTYVHEVDGNVTKVEGLTVERLEGGRSVITVEVPDNLTPKEAQKFVTAAMQTYTDACMQKSAV